MGIEFKQKMTKYNDEAIKYLKAHFGGEYPEYFKDSFGEDLYRQEVMEFLFDLEHGKLTTMEFSIEMTVLYSHIDAMRIYDEPMYYARRDKEFPQFPSFNRDTVN